MGRDSSVGIATSYELNLYFPSGSLLPVIGQTLPLPCFKIRISEESLIWSKGEEEPALERAFRSD